MLEGNRCELCEFVIETPKALHKQTKYHEACAREMKKRNTLAYWTRAQRKAYMREYMQCHRQHRKDKETAQAIDTVVEANQTLVHTTETSTKGTNAIAVPLVLNPFFLGTVSEFSFESIFNVLRHLQILVLEAAALVVIVIIAWQHVREIWKK